MYVSVYTEHRELIAKSTSAVAVAYSRLQSEWMVVVSWCRRRWRISGDVVDATCSVPRCCWSCSVCLCSSSTSTSCDWSKPNTPPSTFHHRHLRQQPSLSITRPINPSSGSTGKRSAQKLPYELASWQRGAINGQLPPASPWILSASESFLPKTQTLGLEVFHVRRI